MKEFLGVFAVMFAIQAAQAGELPPGENMPLSSVQTIVMRGAAIPEAVGMTHVCGAYYPLEAPAERPKAGPLLSFRITVGGDVKDVIVVQSSGIAVLDRVAVACAKTWKYNPATLMSKPIEVDWQNNVAWTVPKPVVPRNTPDIVIQTDVPATTITTQRRIATSPPISPPVAVGNPHICKPHFPAEAGRAGMQGTTTVGFTITEQGTVENSHVVKSSGYDLLDQAAVTCTLEWLYKPAHAGDKPVAVPWQSQVKWALAPE